MQITDLAKMLLKNGVPVDGKDEKGQTALSCAISRGVENTDKVLLEAGASVDSKMAERALKGNHPSIFKVLLEYCKDLSSNTMESALFKAVQKNLHSIVAALVDRGTAINAYNEMQYTPLLLACETGKIESAEVLIEKGANLRIRTPDSDTTLHLAVQAGATSITNLLLRKGMEANITNQAGETPLHIAALHNKGAFISANSLKKTPLQVAEINRTENQAHIVTLLKNWTNLQPDSPWLYMYFYQHTG
uniref:Uncharacterized protein n=1 Tax=Nothoprocta perdicaria TaxID=30464 RepID=A0A8C6ZUT6_NOTPE